MNLYVQVVINHWDLYRFIENLVMLHLSYHGIIRLDSIQNPPKISFKPINFQVTIDRHPVRFFVHKRPHVDFFLSVV